MEENDVRSRDMNSTGAEGTTDLMSEMADSALDWVRAAR
jgi:phytoene/squalene synthetase